MDDLIVIYLVFVTLPYFFGNRSVSLYMCAPALFELRLNFLFQFPLNIWGREEKGSGPPSLVVSGLVKHTACVSGGLDGQSWRLHMLQAL